MFINKTLLVIPRRRRFLTIYNHYPKILIGGSKKMSSSSLNWKEEKSRLMSLTDKEREKELMELKSSIVNFREIPSWKEQFEEMEVIPSDKRVKGDRDGGGGGGSRDVNESLCNKISLWKGDITQLSIDCIVNAGKESLLGGGGVDGAIHRAAGKMLYEECKTLNGCSTGQAKMTSGYRLPAKFVIHTVGPQGINKDLLTNAYRNSCQLMLENNCRSIAFPCISTGVYGYPSESAAPVAIETVKAFMTQNIDKIDRVIFCLFLEKDVEIYEKLMQVYFPIHSI